MLSHTRACFQTPGEKSGIEKRFFHINEEILAAHPDFNDREKPSLQARIEMTVTEVPKLAARAAAKAIAEWGRPATDITHVVFSTYSGARSPSADLRLASLLGLRPSVCRTTLSLHGCSGGVRALHLAKDIAENNHGARVLVVCAEVSLISYSGPTDGCVDSVLGPALFGDGAGAVILGAGPVSGSERPLFETVCAAQTTVPMTEAAITTQFAPGGMEYRIGKQVPGIVEQTIRQCLLDVTGPLGIDVVTWNDLFWAVHCGGRAILDSVEAALGLGSQKLAASRHVLREYGNMSSAAVVFVLEEVHRRLTSKNADGETAEWGVMVAFGPGVTVEIMVLRATTNLEEK
jgi:bisdemethoxycurcumin synthase